MGVAHVLAEGGAAAGAEVDERLVGGELAEERLQRGEARADQEPLQTTFFRLLEGPRGLREPS